MKKTSISLLALILWVGIQPLALGQNIAQFGVFTNGSAGNVTLSFPGNTDGTNLNKRLEMNPYLNDAPMKAVIYQGDKENIIPESRFNMSRNSLEKIENGTIRSEFTPQHIDGFLLYEDDALSHAFVRAQPRGYDQPVFLEVLVQGDKSLYVYRRLIYKKGDEHQAYNSGFDDRVEVFVSYFVVDDVDGLHRLPPRKGKVLGEFGDYSDQIKDYAKQNNLDYSKLEDLATIFQYYNSLQG